MERREGCDFIVHRVTDPATENQAEVQEAVKSALCGPGEGGVIATLIGGAKKEVFSSGHLKRTVKDPTAEELARYAVEVTSLIIGASQEAIIYEYLSS